jgi:hypothetical protein
MWRLSANLLPFARRVKTPGHSARRRFDPDRPPLREEESAVIHIAVGALARLLGSDPAERTCAVGGRRVRLVLRLE